MEYFVYKRDTEGAESTLVYDQLSYDEAIELRDIHNMQNTDSNTIYEVVRKI